MVLVNTGTYLVYDIANNQVTGTASLGQVGPNWQVGGFAAAAPTGSAALMDSGAQLVQAMASFAAPPQRDRHVECRAFRYRYVTTGDSADPGARLRLVADRSG